MVGFEIRDLVGTNALLFVMKTEECDGFCRHIHYLNSCFSICGEN